MDTSDTITLFGGRTIRLQSIDQWRTYAGLLEGLPTDRLNRVRLDRAVEQERSRYGRNEEPYLVPPVVQRLEQHEPYPFGRPEALPSISCVGRFESEPARDLEEQYSTLTIIWFQDQFAFPIDPAVLEHIRGVDWNARAYDTGD